MILPIRPNQKISLALKYSLIFISVHTVLVLVLVYSNPENSYAEKKDTHLIYTVKRGDTLSGIALRYKISVKQLRRWNSLRGDKIFEGQRLDDQLAAQTLVDLGAELGQRVLRKPAALLDAHRQAARHIEE